MRLVIADTSPVNYLILIGHIDLLPALFETVMLPSAVRIEVRDAPLTLPDDPSLHDIDAGETAAIQLALSLHADLLLMDDRKGVKIARNKGLRVTGTLGILELATQARLIDFAEAASRIQRTTFRSPEGLIDAMLKKHAKDGGNV